MNTDLTFISNEPPTFAEASAGKEANLLNRFKILIQDAEFFAKAGLSVVEI